MNVNVCVVSGSAALRGFAGQRGREHPVAGDREAHAGPLKSDARPITALTSPRSCAASRDSATTARAFACSDTGRVRHVLGDRSLHRSVAIHVVAIHHPQRRRPRRRPRSRPSAARTAGPTSGTARPRSSGRPSALAHHPRRLMVSGVRGENLGNRQLRPCSAAHDPHLPARCQQLGPRSASLRTAASHDGRSTWGVPWQPTGLLSGCPTP